MHNLLVDYLALIADIVASRTIEDRARYQDDLAALLSEINRISKRSLASSYTITLGDEFQALYRNPATLFQDIFRIIAYSSPYKIRFAVAQGEITTALNPKQSIGMDGPAFQSARQLLERLKKQHRTIVQIQLPDSTATRLSNMLLRSICQMTEIWHENAVKVLSQMLYSKKIAEAADSVGLSEGTTYKHIREKYLKDHVDSLEYLSTVIAKILKDRITI